MELDIRTTNKFKQAYKKIQEAKNILLVTHERPDGDALASVCALVDLLEKFEKKYTAFCYDKPTTNFSFLPHVEKIISEKNKINFSKFDLIIVLDCGNLKRTRLTQEIQSIPLLVRKSFALRAQPSESEKVFIIEFDHHPKTDDYADLEIRLPEASATAEILYYLFKINKIRLNKNIATCILTGILTDTSNFLYPGTSDKTTSIASEMLVYGAQFTKIMKKTWQNKNIKAMKLWGIVLSRLEINKKYNIAFSILTKEEIKKYKGDEDILDGIANFLGNLADVKATLLLREEDDNNIKGSLRSSHPKTDISKLATILGGGGHPKASGFLVKGRLKKTEKGWKVI